MYLQNQGLKVEWNQKSDFYVKCQMLQKVTSAQSLFRTVHHQITSQPQCQFEHCSHVEPQSSSKLEAEFSTNSIIGLWSH
jgi:hypothetical protein